MGTIPIIGVDFGQAADYSAIALGFPQDGEMHIRHVERLQLGMKYEKQIERIRWIYCRTCIQTKQKPRIIVDGTGVGRAVVEMLVKSGFSPIVVTVTGGNNINREGRNWNIPKKHLVSPLIVGVQNQTVKIARSLEHADILMKEMQNFKLKINIATGNESFEAWRERDHDDLVFACALIVFADKKIAEPGVAARSRIPSKYAEGMGNWNKYRS